MALQATAPNWRDYCPQGEAAFAQAQKQHLYRLRRLESVLAEVEILAGYCTHGKVTQTKQP